MSTTPCNSAEQFRCYCPVQQFALSAPLQLYVATNTWRASVLAYAGAVLDGRDVGTVICPDAAVKLFITASVEVRAQRRLDELTERGEQTSFEAVLADMQARDERDTKRATAPLKPADDAVMLDTTSMSIQNAYDTALQTVTAAMPAGHF